MANPKDVLVLTTSSVDGLKIKRYLRPVSAHVVAGTNLFSDFLGGLTDIFGGRSQTYQKQLTSLYNEAIERVKYAAYEIGANCIVGLNIDMDEISGKGKSMFMLTAVGTAIILEKEVADKLNPSKSDEKLENVGVERINVLRIKREIIENANTDILKLNDDTWNFITINQVDEVFPTLLKKYKNVILNEQNYPGSTEKFHKLLVGYIDGLPENKKLDLLYKGLIEENEQIALKISEIIKELNLFDFDRSMSLLKNESFEIKKRGVRVVTYDKPFYGKQDIHNLQNIKKYIQETFIERGTRTTKKQLLSSKEIEVWTCECGKTNDIEAFCSGCGQDINGFKRNEMKPTTVANYIEQKIDLISEYI
uniref:YbjQ family protein n=1 Tax=Pedobacter schmidteae TaxID=2201271 RepID=UPI000EB5ADFF|nr:YbjQ family protein [Pedobacter schmidteae]